jgi:glycosyltransferase involved in cell wall biosynthesis
VSDQRITVLHVVNSLDPGGMENGIVNLTRALEPRGFEAHVACLERRGAFADRLPSPSRVTILGKRDGFSPAATWRLARHITSLRPDIVHSHNLGALIYSSLATLGGRRCALLQGEHSQLTPAERQPRRLRQRRWLYRGCRAIHTVSQAMRQELVDCGFPAAQITAIANGVDTGRFVPGDRTAARQALGIPSDAICLGIIGRFGPFKRHLELLDAFETIAAEVPAARLLIAGGGGSEEAAVTRRVAASAACERIHLAGFQNDPRLCYQALDLLAVPSTNEGLSNAVLEAMACAVPALVRTGCGHEQVITSGVDGWIAPLESPADFAAQLSAILREPARLAESGARARQTVQSRFSLDSMVNAYESLYRACAPMPR